MKTKQFAFALLAAAPLSLLFADDVPKPFTFARYQAMLDRSPFAVATAVAAPSATPNFAKDLYVANAAHSKDGDFVTIASSADKNFKKYLTTSAPEDGYSITNIEWSEKVGATKVTIAKDGQTATLAFNEALLKQSVATGQPPQGCALLGRLFAAQRFRQTLCAILNSQADSAAGRTPRCKAPTA